MGTHAAEMVTLASQIWGPQNRALSTRDEIRFGAKGSKAVKLAEDLWFDHELNIGGGFRDLYKLATGEFPKANGHDRTVSFRIPDGMGRELGPPVAWWDYPDEHGTTVARVVRFEPSGAGKTFRQCRPNGTGWEWKLGGLQIPLYRLPDLLRAPKGATVFIVEGERKADALRAWGLLATTNAGGSKKFRADHAKVLADFACVVLPDNDQAGREHEVVVVRALREAGCKSIRSLNLPNLAPKDDIIDWIRAGNTAAEFQALVAKATPERVDSQEHHAGAQAGTARGARGDRVDFVWPQPVDFLTDPHGDAPELRHEHIPPVLNDFIFDAADRMGVDPTSVALGAIVACASVVSDDWQVQPKVRDYTWTESPRLWGAILGDPSIMKSPIIAAVTSPIDKMDAAARAIHAEAMRSYRKELKAYKADKSGDTAEPRYPRLDRHMVESATVEALSEALRDDDQARQRAPAGKVLCRQDEMSEFFGGMDRYRAGGNGGSDRGAYLRLYNGGRFTVDRIVRGSFSVPNWSACFLGGIQPGPIQSIAKSAHEDGLLQRFFYAVSGPQQAGIDRRPSTAALRQYDALFPALAALRRPPIADGEHPQPVVFHADAQQHREAVDLTVQAMRMMPDITPQLMAAYGKFAGMFARLTLTFHLIEIASARAAGAVTPYLMVIPEETARRAAAFMLDIALPHLLRAHRLMYATKQTGHAAWIAGYILAERFEQISSRDVVRAYRALHAPEDKDELIAVMASLVTIGWLEPEVPTNLMKPVHSWLVNPSVHVLFADRAEREKARRNKAKADLAAHFEALRRKKEVTGSPPP